ncbi:MAG: hypothetical protein Q9160_005020 [Pyrenula sp. 1 TL-2023]
MSFIDDSRGRQSGESARAPAGFSTTTRTKQNTNSQELYSPVSHGSNTSSPRQGHQRLVFSDPVAFRYLEEDPSTVVLDRRRKLQGYEIYLVEQWACSRVHPTFIIATYTGDPSHYIYVGILGVPRDESTWSTRMRVYFEAVSQYHARRKETPLGTLMVTNLSGFPSALNVIAVPDGDVKKHREDFIVNEDLKRLGCSGRAGMNLTAPSSSTRAKFQHLYRTNDRVPFYTAVMDLVKTCQVALTVFDKLAPAYADGLLCDITEKAINDWWSDIGTDMYNIEPSDGILGPTTVSALIGTLIGAHNRLKAASAPVAKDAFDIDATKRAIGYFQKSQKLDRTRRLDRATLDKLHRMTAKAASNEGWNVPKAVKSTVAELGGKGGEMVMGIVGGREKVGIAEIETVDLERFVELVTGPRLRWLWHGKPIKTGSGDVLDTLSVEGNRVFSTDEQGNFIWTSKKRDSVWSAQHDRSVAPEDTQSGDTRSGLGRLKDVVGRRTHPRIARDDSVDSDIEETVSQPYAPALETITSQPEIEPSSEAIPSIVNNGEVIKSPDPMQSQSSLPEPVSTAPLVETSQPAASGKEEAIQYIKGPNSEPSNFSKAKLDSPRFTQFRGLDYNEPQSKYLRRSQSAIKLFNIDTNSSRAEKFPRHLSFSFVEDGVFTHAEPDVDLNWQSEGSLPARMAMQQANATKAQTRARRIIFLEQATVPFVESQVARVEEMDSTAQGHLEKLNALYYEHLEDHQMLRATSNDIVNDERLSLTDGLKQVEVLGQKLDYELNALESRVIEVEDGIAEFERGIVDIEGRVDELVEDPKSQESWWVWLTGFFVSNKV